MMNIRMMVMCANSLFYFLALFSFFAYGAEVSVEMDGTGYIPESTAISNTQGLPITGVDISWPMQTYATLRKHEYENFLKKCFQKACQHKCEKSERQRIQLNRSQPIHMTNLTATGYAKVECPAKSIPILHRSWRDHHYKLKQEYWEPGSTYVNHWEAPTQYLELSNYLSLEEQRTIVGLVGESIERWSGVEVIPVSIVGIRMYQEGAIIPPQVDLLPHVLSCIIQVAQDVSEPWPTELIDHSGNAVNVTLDTSNMLLYEGTSIIHGRPYPLKGNYYAEILLHFTPTKYMDLFGNVTLNDIPSVESLYEKAFQKSVNERSSSTSNGLPRYIEETSKEAVQWRQEFIFLRKSRENKRLTKAKGVTDAHIIAANGDVSQLKMVAEIDRQLLFTADSNGWKPIHEAARAGRTKILEYLLEQGADVNDRTNNGEGGSPLWWAEHGLNDNHPAIEFLRQNGGVAIAPNNN